MSKKLLAVIALVVASLFVFTACSGEDYKFDALENNPAPMRQYTAMVAVTYKKANTAILSTVQKTAQQKTLLANITKAVS